MSFESSPTLVGYLHALTGDSPATAFLELRHRVADHTLTSDFVPVNDDQAVASAIRSLAARTDVYIGCAPRIRRSGTKKDIRQVWVLWAECDGEAAARAAHRYDPPPAIIVASGSGPNLHAYWPLRQPMTPPEAEVANLRLAHALGADRACYDAARILRPPGTWNHKRQPPTPVAALRLESAIRFEASDVVARAPVIDVEPVQRRWTDRGERDSRGDPLLDISPAVYVGELLGVQARSGRKVNCPFHADERPSLHVYPTASRGWCCFSCGRGGSVYDLAAAVWGLGTRGRDFVELRRRLTEHFALEMRRSARGIER